MTVLEIPFRPEFREPMLSGQKVMTCRNRRYGQAGDVFDAFGQRFVLTHVMRIPLRYVFADCYLQEGCRSKQDLIAVWKKIHPYMTVDHEAIVWAHCFRKWSHE